MPLNFIQIRHHKWIWQQPDWPSRQQKASQVFRYDHAALTPKLRELHFLQGGQLRGN